MNRARASLALSLAFATTLFGCGAPEVALVQCQRDDQCGDGSTCQANSCLPREAPPTTWSIEIAPRSESAAAPTEVTGVTAPAATFDLHADAKVDVTGTLALDTVAAPLTTAHVVVSVPSAIAGRPALQFETDLDPGKVPGPPTFTVAVPAALLGRVASFDVFPLAPSDKSYAPAHAEMPLATTVAVPIATTQRLTVRGRLVSALLLGRAGFTARAFLGKALVSNVASTGADGAFTLLVPPSDAIAAPSPGITVELAPPDGSTDPRFSSKPFALGASSDLGDLTLPAFGQPNVFRFLVVGDGAQAPTVGSALVRAWTLLAETDAGKTDFVRAAPTDGSGRASLGLLPGTTNALRDYDVAVVPPPDSDYGVRCIPKFPLSSGGTADAPAILPSVILTLRTRVNGVVRGHDGAPAAGVTVLATRTTADASSPCAASVASTPAAVTTDGTGAFSLRLDPGTYRLDYDPPAGAPLPRLTEGGFVVPLTTSGGTPLLHDTSLPAGAVVEGTVLDADGMALPLAAIRFYERACVTPSACLEPQGGETFLRAQARSDMTGKYRAVIPVGATTP